MTSLNKSGYYELEMTRFEPQLTTQSLQTKNPRDIEVLVEAEKESLVVDVRRIVGKADLGNLLLFLNAGRAFVRLLEHRDFIARDPRMGKQTEEEIVFRDETGEYFQIPLQDTISRAEALHALRFWLANLERIPELSWE